MTRQHIGPWLGGLLALALAGAFCALGLWQLQRGQAKQVLVDSHARAVEAPALPLAAALASSQAVMPVSACGQWLPTVLVLDNQQQDGQAGHRSYQGWRSDAGTLLLVERGWRAWDGQRSPPQVPALAGHQCLDGLLLPWPSAGLRAGGVDSQPLPGGHAHLLARLQPDTVAGLLGVAAATLPPRLPPRLLRPARGLGEDPPPSAAILPNTLPPEKHLGYAVQWFGLAATVLVVATLLLWRRRRPPSKEPEQ